VIASRRHRAPGAPFHATSRSARADLLEHVSSPSGGARVMAT
jgi:hypothetical protein